MQPYAKVWIGQQILKTLYTKCNIKRKNKIHFCIFFISRKVNEDVGDDTRTLEHVIDRWCTDFIIFWHLIKHPQVTV